MAFNYEDGELGPDFDENDFDEQDNQQDDYEPSPSDLNDQQNLDQDVNNDNSPEQNEDEENDLENEDSSSQGNENEQKKPTNNNVGNFLQKKLPMQKLSLKDLQSMNPLNSVDNDSSLTDEAKEQAKEAVKREVKKKATQAAVKAGSKVLLAYGWPVIVGIVVIFLLLIIIMVVASSIGGQDQQSMLSNSTITSEHFYGIRTAYIDDQQLSNELQLSYKNYVVDVLDVLDDNSDITLNISLPEITDNTTEINENINKMSIGIASIVANGTTNTSANFLDLYPSINHFGLTANELDLTQTFMHTYLTSSSIITIGQSTDLNALLIDATQNNTTTKYMLNVCDKVMIKDYILGDEGLSIQDKYNFLYAVYMPKMKVNISNVAYRVRLESAEESMKITVNNNNENLLIYDTEKSWPDDKLIEVEHQDIPLETFRCIDINNLEQYKEGVSLFKAITLLPEGASYFKKNENDVYNYVSSQENSYYITFISSNNKPFQFAEFEIQVELAS